MSEGSQWEVGEFGRALQAEKCARVCCDSERAARHVPVSARAHSAQLFARASAMRPDPWARIQARRLSECLAKFGRS